MKYCLYKFEKTGKVISYRCAPDTEKKPPDLPEGWGYQYKKDLKNVTVYERVDVDPRAKEEDDIGKKGAEIIRRMAREELGLPLEVKINGR